MTFLNHQFDSPLNRFGTFYDSNRQTEYDGYVDTMATALCTVTDGNSHLRLSECTYVDAATT